MCASVRRVNERGTQRAGFHMEASASINCYGANHRTSPAITPRRAFATIVNTADSPEAVAQLLARYHRQQERMSAVKMQFYITPHIGSDETHHA